nr:MAG TPA: Elongator complex protein [Caudoviricetes sp.]
MQPADSIFLLRLLLPMPCNHLRFCQSTCRWCSCVSDCFLFLP